MRAKGDESPSKGLLGTTTSPVCPDDDGGATGTGKPSAETGGHATTWYTDEQPNEVGKLDDDAEFPPLTLPSDWRGVA